MDNLFRKTALLLFISACTASVGYSQFGFGVGSTLGLGYLRSSQLKQSGPVYEDMNPDVQNLDFKVQAAVQVGFQGVIQYRFAQQWCIVASPGVRLFRSTFNNLYSERQTLSSTDYIEQKIISVAKFKCTQLQLPIIAKYYIHPDKPYFATAGFAFSYNTGMRMYSEEDSITSYYNTTSGLASSNKQDIEFKKLKVDGYKPFQAHMILGVGTSVLTGYRRNLDIELSYHIPLTSSSYYTSDPAFSNQALTNAVFSANGKAAYETTTGKNLDHFRMHLITITVRYLIYSINK